MTADTLSAEELIELVARLRSLSGLLKLTPDESDACHDAAETIAKLATPELIALGEAAVHWERENELQQNTISADMKLFLAVRAYAASVASIPTKPGVE